MDVNKGKVAADNDATRAASFNCSKNNLKDDEMKNEFSSEMFKSSSSINSGIYRHASSSSFRTLKSSSSLNSRIRRNASLLSNFIPELKDILPDINSISSDGEPYDFEVAQQ
eukprot:scaffold1886_cov97-Cylindrotheca_fusiformis.AAC.1